MLLSPQVVYARKSWLTGASGMKTMRWFFRIAFLIFLLNFTYHKYIAHIRIPLQVFQVLVLQISCLDTMMY